MCHLSFLPPCAARSPSTIPVLLMRPIGFALVLVSQDALFNLQTFRAKANPTHGGVPSKAPKAHGRQKCIKFYPFFWMRGKYLFPWFLFSCLVCGKGKSLLCAHCIFVCCSALLLVVATAQQDFGMLQSPQSYGKFCMVVALHAHHAHQWTFRCLLHSSAYTSGSNDVGKMLRRSQAWRSTHPEQLRS